MSKKLNKYLDGVFSLYEDSQVVKELKEELFNNLQEKLNDLKNQGYDDEAAYSMTIGSIGDISELIESIAAKTRELQQMGRKDFSNINLQNSDLKGVKVHKGKFNASALKESDFSDSDLTSSSFKSSDLQNSDFKRVNVHDGEFNASGLEGSDFSGSDLTNCSFKCCNLTNVRFDDANLFGAKIIKSALKGASFKSCVLDNTTFSSSDLAGVCFDNQTLIGTIFNCTGLKATSFKNVIFRNVYFKNAEVKKAIFDGATMDKLTYAVLKGSNANLTNVTVI